MSNKHLPINKNIDCIINFVDCTGAYQNSPSSWLFERFAGALQSYDKVCATGALQPGMVQFVRVDRKSGDRSSDEDLNVVNFAFRKDLRSEPDPSIFKIGLEKIKVAMDQRKLTGVAVPYVGLDSSKLDEKQLTRFVNDSFSNTKISASFFKLPTVRDEIKKSPIITVLESPAIGKAGLDRDKLRDSAHALAEGFVSKGWRLRTTGCAIFEKHMADGFKRAGGSSEIFLPWQDFEKGKPVIASPSARTLTRAGPSDLAIAITTREAEADWQQLEDGYKKVLASATQAIMGNDLKSKTDLVVFVSTNENTLKQSLARGLAHKANVPFISTRDPSTLTAERIQNALVSGRSQKISKSREPELA